MKSRSPKILIFLTIFIDLLGFGIVIPIIAFIADDYVAQKGWSREVIIGGTMSVYSAMQMIFSPILGRLSDRYGRRPILLLSLFGSTASYFIFALSNNIAVILLSRAVGGICAANIATAQAYISDVTEEKDRTAGMGLIGAAFGLGFAFGPVFGGLAAWKGREWFPSATHQICPGLLAAAICGLNFLWAMRSLPESLPPERRGQARAPQRFASLAQVARSLSHRVIGPLVGVFFFATIGFSNLEMAIGLYLKKTPGMNFTEKGIYGIFIYIGLLLAFMHGYVVRKAVKFVPEAILAIVGTFIQAVGLAVTPISPGLPSLLTGMAIIAIGQGFCVPALLSLVSKAAGRTEQGEVLGVTQSASSLARIMGPMFAGMMIGLGKHYMGEAGYSWPFWSGAALMLAATWMAVVTRRRILELPIENGAA